MKPVLMSKQLPKKAIYAKFQMNTAAKEKIDADISRITIVNEIAPNKVNIPAGDEVEILPLPAFQIYQFPFRASVVSHLLLSAHQAV